MIASQKESDTITPRYHILKGCANPFFLLYIERRRVELYIQMREFLGEYILGWRLSSITHDMIAKYSVIIVALSNALFFLSLR
jgi:hypothetical protein